MRLGRYFRLMGCRNARILILFLLLCTWSIWEYNLPFGPFYRYDISDGYKSRCCGPDSTLDVCRWPFCEPCKVSDVADIKKDSQNVFFIETSKSNELNVRQACAVESAALQNPNLNIFMLMTGVPNKNSTSMSALSTYSNIHIRHIELGDYFLHTPLEQWYFCTKWNYGPYAISHLSDALRFLTLYKYGGYYFDLDFVMLKSVEKYKNFLAPESHSFLAAGAIHLEPDHPLIERAVEEFRTTYQRGDWGYNGPQLLTRVMKTWCHVDKLPMMTTATCRDVTVLPIEYFYPVHWLNWESLFSNVSKPEDFGGSLAAHLWNKFSHSLPVIKDSNQLYNLLAKKNCPHVYTVIEKEF